MEGDAPVERYLGSRIAIPAYATAQASLLDPFRKDYRGDDNPSCELRELKFRKTRKQVCHAYLRDEEGKEDGVIDPLLWGEPAACIRILYVGRIVALHWWWSTGSWIVRGRTWLVYRLVRALTAPLILVPILHCSNGGGPTSRKDRSDSWMQENEGIAS